MSFDWGSAFSAGSQGGLIPGAAAGYFSGRNNDKVDKYLKQIPDELRKYLEPYITAGQGALGDLGDLQNEYSNMYKDPNAIIDRIGKGYQKSPGFDWQLEQGENAINNASAAGGMAGTAQHQQQAGELATNLANKDYGEYLDRGLNLFKGGLSGRTGIAQDIFGKGAGASSDLAQALASYLNGMAGVQNQRGMNQNQQMSDAFSNIMSMLAKFAG